MTRALKTAALVLIVLIVPIVTRGAEPKASAPAAPSTKSPIVSSVNGLTGNVTIAAGANVVIAPSGNGLTISAAAGRTLFLNVDRAGYGTVATSSGASCTRSCLVDFSTPASVTLTATPSPGAFFQGWSGDCTGLGACSVTMSNSHAVTANFGVITAPLGIQLDGPGVVYSSPLGLYCGAMCLADFETGTPIHLTAVPIDGEARFMEWLSGCPDDPHSPSCRVIAGDETSIEAQFGFVLDVSVSGQGFVGSDPPGIACPAGCTAVFPEGPAVNLTATPRSGWTFTGWSSGPCAASGANPCAVPISRAWGIEAVFEPN